MSDIRYDDDILELYRGLRNVNELNKIKENETVGGGKRDEHSLLCPCVKDVRPLKQHEVLPRFSEGCIAVPKYVEYSSDRQIAERFAKDKQEPIGYLMTIHVKKKYVCVFPGDAERGCFMYSSTPYEDRRVSCIRTHFGERGFQKF
jgi:hypothetical protein